jgi:hypothetical protein
MAASCVACSTFTRSPRQMREGPMCARCARFVSAHEDAELTLVMPQASELERLADALLADLAAAELAA